MKMLNKIILGAGPSGLFYSLLEKSKYPIIEKNAVPGGHASSYHINGFTFDYGPHIMFSRNKDILKFMCDSLFGNVATCVRNNKVSFKDKLVKYPFENDLGSLSAEDNFDCIKDFLFNDYKKKSKPKNMKEWFYHTFGKSISEKYLIPYNEKVWNVPVEKLSMVWADRIPNPPILDVLKSSVGLSTEGYTHQLYYQYPKRGGYQAISESLAKPASILYSEKVEKIEIIDKRSFKIITNKSEYSAKEIISTINLSSLLKACNSFIPQNVKKAYEKLIVNPMYIVSIGIQGNDPDKMTAIYFADKEFLVNRISYPGTFSKYNCPKNTYSIQAEITYNKLDSVVKNMSDSQIISHVTKGLKKRNLINGKIIFKDLKRMPESYVVYDTNYAKNVNIIRNYFKSIGIVLVGRFSFFEYVNVDMAIDRAIQVFKDQTNSTKPDTFYLKQAYVQLSKKSKL